VDQGILERLQEEEGVRRNQIYEVTDLPFYIEEVTNGLYFEPQENLKKIILTPQFHASPSNWLYPFEEVTLCHYAFDAQYVHHNEEPPAVLKEGAKALSDVNRLKILRYLRNEPKSFIEVVRHLDIAKSTAYEHTIVLRAAGLIRSHVIGDSAVSYSLRKEGFAKLKDEITEWIN
jgi:DNA-binding transcriptional ArsR family regulator